MSGTDLVLQLFALLLGLSVAELLSGLARSWRIQVGATVAGDARIRIGWLVPLLALLVLCDQTHFWLAAYELRGAVAFDYATLLGVLGDHRRILCRVDLRIPGPSGALARLRRLLRAHQPHRDRRA